MIYFKQWLESQEEPTPFEQWHKQYMDSIKSSINRNYIGGIGVEKTPKKPDELLKDPRVSELFKVVEIISIDGFSYGVHAYGDQEDIPAGDPFSNAEIEVLIDGNTERKLIGKNAFVVDESGGSFHERWARMKVYVILDDTIDADGLDFEFFSKSSMRKIVKFFKFQSIKQASEVIEKLEPNLSFPVKDGETRDDYWKRVISSVNPENLDRYNSNDNYYKKGN